MKTLLVSILNATFPYRPEIHFQKMLNKDNEPYCVTRSRTMKILDRGEVLRAFGKNY